MGIELVGIDLTVVTGLAATALLLVAVAYAARKRAMSFATRRKLGTARGWLRAHVVVGSLFLLLVGLHGGFALPGGLLPKALWLLSLWTVLSGLLGLAIQRFVPRILSAASQVEVHYDRIPELVTDIRRRADALAKRADTPVRNLYQRSLAPMLAAPQRNLSVLLDAGGRRRTLDPVHRLQEILSREQRQRLDELESLVRTKLDLDTHYTLQQVLRGWLWLHAPASILLVFLVAVHVASYLYY